MAPIRVLCLAVAAALSCAALAVTLRVTVDSDTVFAVLLHRDLQLWGGAAGEWNLPPAPCWFPDVASVWAALSLGAAPVSAMRAAGIGLLLLGLAGWVVLAERREPMVLGVALLALGVPQLAAAGVQLEAHGGIAALTPWALWLLSGRGRKRRRVALAALLLVLTASDSLTLMTLVVPLALATRDRSSWALLGAGLLGALVGHVSRPRALLASYMDIDPTDSWRALGALGHWLRSMLVREPWTAAWVVLALLVLVYAARNRPAPPVRFALWSLSITLGSLVAFGQFLDEGGARYVMPVFLSLSACALWQISRRVRLAPRAAWIAIVGLGGLSASVYARAAPAPSVPRSAILQPLERELAARDLHFGAAPYWDAKLLTALSTRGTFLTSLAPNRVAPYAWNANAVWPARFAPTFLFVPLADPIYERDAQRMYGTPFERVPIEDHVLLTYADPTVIARHFAPYLVDLGVTGAEARFDAAYGERTEQIAYRGPHAMVPPGRYHLRLERAPGSMARGSYRARAGRLAHAEGEWPAELDLEVPRPAPLLIEIVAAKDAVGAITVRRD